MEVLQRTANRGSISTGYDIDNSLKFEADNSESLTKSAATGGDRKKATLSLWCKRTELTGSQASILFLTGVNGNKYTTLAWGTGDEINFHYYNTGTYPYNFLTDREFRDMSAWYHIVVAVDTTQSTASDRVKFYVNGVQETSFSTEVYPTQNIDTPFNNDSATYPMEIGNDSVFSMGGDPIAGYLADYYLIDGQQLAPTEFGEFDEDSGIWKPKAYTGTFGNNGFYLDFADASDLGDDESGNGNDFTEVNITSADQSVDSPTNNFAIGNANVYFSNPTFATFNPITEGGTKITKGAGGWETLSSTIAVTSGKWYMEMQNISVPESAMMSVFPADIEFLYQGGQINNYAGKVSGDGGISYYSYNGNIYQNASNSAYGSAWANETNTMAIALDMDNGKVYFARANTWQNSGDPTSGATGTGAIDLIEPSKPHMMGYSIYAQNTSGAVNFGGYTPSSISSAASDANGYGTFEYAPPSGYYALCGKNLAEYGGTA